MRAAERRHQRECAELKRELDGCAETLIVRVAEIIGPEKQESYEIWCHAFRQACAHPDNEQAVAYSIAAMEELR